jgi:hypothetical protein
MAEATLASADSERRLVTHWFLTGEDDSVNSDDHFGSDERTLRFLGMALPTLIDQLGATLAVVALPWDLEGGSPTLTVIAVTAGAATAVQARALRRLQDQSGPPFWRLSSDVVEAPARLVAVASGMVV